MDSHSDDDDDSAGPEDLGFSAARTSAVARTRTETQKAKDVLEARKAARTKKQAWFRESKVSLLVVFHILRKSINQSISQAINQSIKSINQSINQSINDQPINQSIDQRIN